MNAEAEIAHLNKPLEQQNEAMTQAIDHIRAGQCGIAAIVLHGAQISPEELRRAEQEQMAPETS